MKIMPAQTDVAPWCYKCMDGMDLLAGRGMEHQIVLKGYILITDLQLGHNHHSSCDLTRTHTQCFVALVIFLKILYATFCSGDC